MATIINPAEYSEILQALDSLDADMEPSEFHGAVCGILCVDNHIAFNTLVNDLFAAFDNNNLLHKEALELCATIFTKTLQQLNDPNCGFYLLLPPEDGTSVEDSVFALGEWCQGFLFGLSLGGVKDYNALPNEAAEICKDFMEIARAGSAYDIQESEDDEQSFQELLEYVRVGVLLINEVLNPNRSTTENDRPVLH
ncbi:UPF0149 family protein [Kaarinaea lacus]